MTNAQKTGTDIY